MEKNNHRPITFGLATTGTLVGGLMLGILVASGIHFALPGHMIGRETISAIPALAGLLGAGAAWGWAMDRLAKTGERRRMLWAGALGFSVPTFIAMLALLPLESLAEDVARAVSSGPPPIHRIFTLLFVPTAFILAGLGAGALGVAQRDRRLAFRMAIRSGLAAGLAFLAVNLIMEALGWVVGAPRAAERATMLTVLAVSCIGASLAGGTAVGYQLTTKEAQDEILTEESVPIEA